VFLLFLLLLLTSANIYVFIYLFIFLGLMELLASECVGAGHHLWWFHEDVLLRYLAYPHQKFGSHAARVTAIARNPLAAAELGFVPPDGTREPLYRIKVELAAQSVQAYGREEPLQPGMQVEADLLLDRRSLVEWVFEPLLSLAGRT
jgi:hypothetical protein